MASCAESSITPAACAKIHSPKVLDSHVVAYVALGSHGAYSSPMTVPEYDSWESGGPLYGPDSFNWYLVWDCIEHVKRVISGREQTFCNVTHKLISGKEQYEPIEGLWPREFTGDAHYLFVYVLHSSDSPWHDDRWFETRPKGPLQVLEFSVFCSVDMHIYDPLGRHIGTNYTTGEFEVSIPNSTYQIGRNGQHVTIFDPVEGDYKVEIVGLGSGTYNFSMLCINSTDIVDYLKLEDVSIAEGETQTFIVNPWARQTPAPELPGLEILAAALAAVLLAGTVIARRSRK